MKTSLYLFFLLLIVVMPNTYSQPANDTISVQIKTKSLNSVFDNANIVFNNINGYITNLPSIPNAIMQMGLTASGIILLYKGGNILQDCAQNLANKKITTEDPAFLWSSLFGGSMILMGLTTTLGAIKFTNIFLN